MAFLALPLVLLHFNELLMVFVRCLTWIKFCCCVAATAVVGLRHDGFKDDESQGGSGGNGVGRICMYPLLCFYGFPLIGLAVAAVVPLFLLSLPQMFGGFLLEAAHAVCNIHAKKNSPLTTHFLVNDNTVWMFFPKQLWSWIGFSILPINRLGSIIIFLFPGNEIGRVGQAEGVEVGVEVGLQLRGAAQHQRSEGVTGMNNMTMANAKAKDWGCGTKQHGSIWPYKRVSLQKHNAMAGYGASAAELVPMPGPFLTPANLT